MNQYTSDFEYINVSFGPEGANEWVKVHLIGCGSAGNYTILSCSTTEPKK